MTEYIICYVCNNVVFAFEEFDTDDMGNKKHKDCKILIAQFTDFVAKPTQALEDKLLQEMLNEVSIADCILTPMELDLLIKNNATHQLKDVED